MGLHVDFLVEQVDGQDAEGVDVLDGARTAETVERALGQRREDLRDFVEVIRKIKSAPSLSNRKRNKEKTNTSAMVSLRLAGSTLVTAMTSTP